MFLKFKNEPLTDFTLESKRKLMEEKLELVDRQKGKHFPIVVNGERVETGEKIVSINPSNFREVVGTTGNANVDIAERAIMAASKAFETWKNVSEKDRANYLFNAASIIRKRKYEFSAWLVEETGKTWAEADADTAEAIDFLEYYGRQMVNFSAGMKVVPIEGEHNECVYIPLGVGIIISPWNFPLAILAGMTAAAVVAGNTVVIKPSSAAPIIAAKFLEVWEEIGLPKGVINYLPGEGGVIGDYLVSHPQTRFINFTGSMEVGLRINKMAAQQAPGQKWIKRVIAEMGGKDAIIVDSEADVDEAVAGIAAAAFGFQGQKCSACSRAIVDKAVYDEVVEKLIERVKTLKVGEARQYGVNVSAVIDEKSYNKILSYIEIGKNEGRVVVGGEKCGENGYFIAPTVIADVKSDSRIAQEEIFGPVLAVIRAEDYDDALRIANDTKYGLTGALYSKNRMKLERAKREFHVGNLYLNKKCTGALVGVHPFGGFNLSGTDSKAGGTDYLLLFMQPKSITEKY